MARRGWGICLTEVWVQQRLLTTDPVGGIHGQQLGEQVQSCRVRHKLDLLALLLHVLTEAALCGRIWQHRTPNAIRVGMPGGHGYKLGPIANIWRPHDVENPA